MTLSLLVVAVVGVGRFSKQTANAVVIVAVVGVGCRRPRRPFVVVCWCRRSFVVVALCCGRCCCFLLFAGVAVRVLELFVPGAAVVCRCSLLVPAVVVRAAEDAAPKMREVVDHRHEPEGTVHKNRVVLKAQRAQSPGCADAQKVQHDTFIVGIHKRVFIFLFVILRDRRLCCDEGEDIVTCFRFPAQFNEHEARAQWTRTARSPQSVWNS